MSALRVVLVDDQPLLLEAFSTILDAAADIEVVGTAQNGREAIQVVTDTHPDIVCMDIEMPEMDGISATAQILEHHQLEVVMLTTFQREDYLIRSLEAGASGFLLKTASAEQLQDSLRRVAAGDALLAPEVTRAVITAAVRSSSQWSVLPPPQAHPAPSAPSEQARTPEHSARAATGTSAQVYRREGPPYAAAEATSPLTARETDVLIQAASGASNNEIAGALFLSPETVKSHISAILLKLQLRNRVQMVAYAFQQGLI